MSGFIAIASSKEITLPDFMNTHIIDIPNKNFSLSQLDPWEEQGVRGILTMPYIYDAGGVGDEYFWLYLEKYMEIGDVLEIVSVPDQLYVYEHVQKLVHENETITINIHSRTYENRFGSYQLHKKNWLEELKHRTLVTYRGVTIIVNY